VLISPAEITRTMRRAQTQDKTCLKLLDSLSESRFPNQIAAQILITALLEGSDSVRDSARRQIEVRLSHLSSKAEREEWLATLLDKLLSHWDDRLPAAEALRAIAENVLRDDSVWPHLYLRLIQDTHRLLRLSSKSDTARVLQSLMDCIQSRAGEHIRPHVTRFHRSRIRRGLVDFETSPATAQALLSSLGSHNLADMDIEDLVAHLRPLTESYDPDVMKSALANLMQMGEQFPSRSNVQGTIDVLDEFREGRSESLPKTLENEMVVLQLFITRLVERLPPFADEGKFPGVVEAIFKALKSMHGTRDHTEALCNFVLQAALTQSAYHAACDMFGEMLTCLEEYCPRSREPSRADPYRRVFHVEQVLKKDRRIRKTLETIAKNIALPDEVRTYAYLTLLRSRPPELMGFLRERYAEVSPSDPLVSARIQAASDLRVLEFAEVVQVLWKNDRKDEKLAQELIASLQALGHRETVPLLIEAAFAAPDSELARKASNALRTNGYEVEIVREDDRRTLNDLSLRQEKTAEHLAKTEDHVRVSYSQIMETDAGLQDARASIGNTLSRMLHTAVDLKGRGVETALRLTVEFEELEGISRAIVPLEAQFEQLAAELMVQVNIAQVLLDNIVRVESEIESCEHDIAECIAGIERCEANAAACRQRRFEALAHAKALRSEGPSQSYNSNNDTYTYDYSSWESAIQSANYEADRAGAEEAEYRARRDELSRELSHLRSLLRSLESRHAELGRELMASEAQIGAFQAALNRLNAQLQTLRHQYQECEARINALVNAFEDAANQADSQRANLADTQHRLTGVSSQLMDRRRTLHKDLEHSSAEVKTHKRELAAVGEDITRGRGKFDIDARRALEDSFRADDAAVEASGEAGERHEHADKDRLHLDLAIRNTLDHPIYRECYGDRLGSILSKLSRRGVHGS